MMIQFPIKYITPEKGTQNGYPIAKDSITTHAVSRSYHMHGQQSLINA